MFGKENYLNKFCCIIDFCFENTWILNCTTKNIGIIPFRIRYIKLYNISYCISTSDYMSTLYIYYIMNVRIVNTRTKTLA